jgi:type VI secretion system protein ImpM
MCFACGFFGKLPARGDFVRTGLPRDFVAHWDAWISGVLPAAVEATKDGWLQAPIWRFGLAPGVCGADPVFGLLLPSIDKVGRPFPLTLACLGDGIDTQFMAAAECLGRAVIAEALPPDVLAERLAHIPAGDEGPMQPPAFGILWRVVNDGPGSLLLPALPDAESFRKMMMGEVA